MEEERAPFRPGREVQLVTLWIALGAVGLAEQSYRDHYRRFANATSEWTARIYFQALGGILKKAAVERVVEAALDGLRERV